MKPLTGNCSNVELSVDAQTENTDFRDESNHDAESHRTVDDGATQHRETAAKRIRSVLNLHRDRSSRWRRE